MRKIVPMLSSIAALGLLAACSNEPEPVAYEADVDDLSGGEIITVPEDTDAVPVNLPETEMTNVPLDASGEPMTEEETVE